MDARIYTLQTTTIILYTIIVFRYRPTSCHKNENGDELHYTLSYPSFSQTTVQAYCCYQDMAYNRLFVRMFSIHQYQQTPRKLCNLIKHYYKWNFAKVVRLIFFYAHCGPWVLFKPYWILMFSVYSQP